MSRFCECGHSVKQHSRIPAAGPGQTDREWCVLHCPCARFEFATELEDTDERELRRPLQPWERPKFRR